MIHKVRKTTFYMNRVKPGQVPEPEIELHEGEYLISVDMKEQPLFFSDRTTADWSVTAYIGRKVH